MGSDLDRLKHNLVEGNLLGEIIEEEDLPELDFEDVDMENDRGAATTSTIKTASPMKLANTSKDGSDQHPDSGVIEPD